MLVVVLVALLVVRPLVLVVRLSVEDSGSVVTVTLLVTVVAGGLMTLNVELAAINEIKYTEFEWNP